MSATDHVLWYRSPATAWTEALPSATAASAPWCSAASPANSCRSTRTRCGRAAPTSRSIPRPCRISLRCGSSSSLAATPRPRRWPTASLMAQPLSQMSFQPAGDLWIDSPIERRRRTIAASSISTGALATVAIQVGGVRFRREAFVSPVDRVIVLRMSADRPRRVGLRLSADQRAARRGECRRGGHARFLARTNRAEHGIPGAALRRSRRSVIASGRQPDGPTARRCGSMAPTRRHRRRCRHQLPRATTMSAAIRMPRCRRASAMPRRQEPIDAMRAAHVAEHRGSLPPPDHRSRRARRRRRCRPTSASRQPRRRPIRRWPRSMSSMAAI